MEQAVVALLAVQSVAGMLAAAPGAAAAVLRVAAGAVVPAAAVFHVPAALPRVGA